MPKISIIIPMYNKWELTRNCLKSLAATIDKSTAEIVAVDNASSDLTPKACPFLGRELFGSSFKYIRNERNLNFAGASNQGARAARGQYLCFLNNDTEASAGWLDPLVDDFDRFSNIAAVGPLLLYPPAKPFGEMVQHLGLVFTPEHGVVNLFAGIPAASRLIRERRFFQAITAACMLMPRALFMDIGAFDEKFINGFEDLDLCARLAREGYRMTVNTNAKMTHLESQSPGRHAHEKANSERMRVKSLHYFRPDWGEAIAEDNLALELTPWLYLKNTDSSQESAICDNSAAGASREELVEMLNRRPLWENGWKALNMMLSDDDDKENFRLSAYRLFKDPEYLYDNCVQAYSEGRKASFTDNMQRLLPYVVNPRDYRQKAKMMVKKCGQFGLMSLSEQYRSWIEAYENFRDKIQPDFAARVKALAEKAAKG